ncbi:MAG: hypothetical protein RhofKO_09480 [Rhodothermales bacterium]
MLALLLVLPSITLAQDRPVLQDLQPLTDQVILLHLSEGHVEHFGLGEGDNDDALNKTTITTSRIVQPSQYTLTSPDEPNYAAGIEPLRVGRKSKASDFTRLWPGLPTVMDHWLYLGLPEPLVPGHTYTLTYQFSGARRSPQNGDTTFVYQPAQTRTEAIHVNQVGYVPTAGMKYAYVSHWMGDAGPLDLNAYANTPCHVVDDATGEAVFSSTLQLRKDLETGGPDTGQNNEGPYANYFGADVWECDFSAFQTPGTYRIYVERVGASFPFRIDADVYRIAFYTTMRGLFHQRSGIAYGPPHTDYTRERDFHPDDGDRAILSTWRYMDGGNAFTELPQNATGEARTFWGGWHDAGDWDRHRGHLEVGSDLLTMFEFAPDHFTDGELNIPESGNGIPDVLDEVMWGVDFMRRMQRADGGVHGGLETIRHPENGVSSVTDTDTWYAYAVDPEASLRYAAVAGHLAYVLRMIDQPDLGEMYATSAVAAYDWALANTASNEQSRLRDDRHYASASLFKLTGEDRFQTQFKADNMISTPSRGLWEFQSHDQEYGSWLYATTDQPNIDTALKNRIRNASINWARTNNIDTAQRRSGRTGAQWYEPSWFGGATTPKSLPLIAAHYLTGEQQYLDWQYTTADYFLGGNGLNMTWVTGLGQRSPYEMLHVDSWYYHYPEGRGPIPGLVPYGPHRWEPSRGEGNGPWHDQWVLRNHIYPAADTWPVHELWFENRYAPNTNEYTVNQTIGKSAAAYGYLTSDQPGPPTGVHTTVETPAPSFRLEAAYPNPFQARTTLTFAIDTPSTVTLEVFDVLGRRVRTLTNAGYDMGVHRMAWDGTDDAGQPTSPGVYLYRIQAGLYTATRSLIRLPR